MNTKRNYRTRAGTIVGAALGLILAAGLLATPVSAMEQIEGSGSPAPVTAPLSDPFSPIVDIDAARQAAQDEASQLLADRATKVAASSRGSSTARVSPVEQGSYHITATFGQPGSWSGGHHTGLDLACPSGTAVHAAADGQVISAGWAGAYGNRIEVDHGKGLVTTYNHLSAIDVAVGDSVSAGEKIADAGSTGRSTGPHLHFEVQIDGQFKDPYTWLGLG